jgi:hypothetical protein
VARGEEAGVAWPEERRRASRGQRRCGGRWRGQFLSPASRGRRVPSRERTRRRVPSRAVAGEDEEARAIAGEDELALAKPWPWETGVGGGASGPEERRRARGVQSGRPASAEEPAAGGGWVREVENGGK